MEIEIVLTKKKLSKSIINQMKHATHQVLQLGTAIGYLINVKKGVYKTVLIKHEGEFYTIPANYTKGDLFIYRKEYEEQFNSWWKAYQTRIREAIYQIYI